MYKFCYIAKSMDQGPKRRAYYGERLPDWVVQGSFIERDAFERVRIIVGKKREKKNWGYKMTSVAYYFDYYRFVTHFDILMQRSSH